MTATESATLHATGSGAPAPAPLELIVVIDSNPVRFARMISAMVNNTAVALHEAAVHDRVVYPVGDPEGADGTVSLRFRPRNPARGVDGLVLEQVVAIVGSMAPVLDVRTDT